MGRRFASEVGPSRVSSELLAGVLKQLPAPMRSQATDIAARLFAQRSSTPGYFDVLANSINIMQDQITRTRLAGELPLVMLVPRLRYIGLMEFDRAKEAIAEGRECVQQALPMLRRYLSISDTGRS
jgi:NTE family protein